jgi:DNA repair exonuclease SbcCD ATPase subunit
MQRITLPGTILGLLLLCTGGILLASEADELRERAKSMRKQASVVAERSHKEHAERLERESVELLEAAERMELKAKDQGEEGDRPDVDQRVQQLKERLQDLRAKEQKIAEVMKNPGPILAKVREQISGTERELQSVHAHLANGGEHRPELQAQAEKLAVASRRIQHLRVAAENLKLAEEHDLAHKLMEQAAAMERDVQKAKQRLAAEISERREQQGEHGPEVVQELRAEIESLRAEVKDLSRKIENR